MINNWRWFISKTLRETIEDRQQIIKMLAAQRDLIKTKKIAELEQALDDLDALCRGAIDKEALQAGREKSLQIADDVLIPYPDPQYRDWVEMFLVVVALVLAFRTFFFQPFKIPTGSMQPTLFGITSVNLLDTRPEAGKGIRAGIGFAQTPVPGKAGRVLDWFRGETWYHMKAEGHWKIIDVSQPTTVRFSKPYGSVKLTFEDVDNPNAPNITRTIWYTWFDSPPYTISQDQNQQQITPLIRIPDNYKKNMISKVEFNQGDDVFKFKVKTGDHLFVNRITYNFRQPRRGDISVFNIKRDDVTHPQSDVPQNDTFYIKRLVALGGENVFIGKGRHLHINGRRLDSSEPGFEFVYSHPKLPNGKAAQPAIKSTYSGHSIPPLAGATSPNLRAGSEKQFKVPQNHLMMFGDNTTSSLDSRYWGAIPKKNAIGVPSFVYWPPLSPRFGWSHR